MITVLVGMPGSGKSTFAKIIPNSNVINQDIIGNRHKCIKKTKDLLKENKSVIIDRCNINKKQRSYWINIAKEFKVETIICVEFCINSELAIERIKNRKNHPTIKEDFSLEKINEIIEMFEREYEKPDISEGFDYIITTNINKPG